MKSEDLGEEEKHANDLGEATVAEEEDVPLPVDTDFEEEIDVTV